MPEINLTTLFLFLVIGNIFTIIFFILYIYFYSSRVKKLKGYVIARFLQTITWTSYFLQIRDLDSITMSVTMVPLAFGLALEVYTLITATGDFKPKKFYTLIVAAFSHSIIYFFVAENIIIRVVIASLFMSFYFGYTWYDFSLHRNKTKMQHAAGWIGFILLLLFMIRAIFTYLFQIDLEVHSGLYFNVLAGIGLMIITFAWPQIYLLLHKEHDKRIILSSEKRLKESNRQLEMYNASNEKLIRIISHDLRTPLSSMISLLDLMMIDIKEKNYSNLGKFVNILSQSAQEEYYLLNNLLQWYSMQSGRSKFNSVKINLDRIMQHATCILKSNIEQKSIHLITNIQKDITFFTDQIMLETIFRNLISNAIKFSYENGTITVNAYQSNENIKIEIQDEGIGISQENINKIFNTNNNYTTSGTKLEKGTGLGLVLCNELIKKNKGTLEIKSEVGKGSTFVVTLPAKN